MQGDLTREQIIRLIKSHERVLKQLKPKSSPEYDRVKRIIVSLKEKRDQVPAGSQKEPVLPSLREVET